jgi:hypothetical protein
MPQQVLVRVRDISKDEHGHPTELTGIERIITYRAFQYTQQNFELIDQVVEDGVDENGQQKYKAVPGNPNLPPEFRTAQNAASHADDTRDSAAQEPGRRRGRPKASDNVIEHTA